MRLPQEFYLDSDVLKLSRLLLGKTLCTKIGKKLTCGHIVETEAYAGITDKASHAYNGRFTERTKPMYEAGGISYVYLCYGIHHLFNVVTNAADIPHAILIRGIEPVDGLETMLWRRKKEKLQHNLTAGPGALSMALGLDRSHTALSLQGDTVWIEDRGIKVAAKDIIASPRVGVAYAKEDALLPYRFRIKGNPWTSPAK